MNSERASGIMGFTDVFLYYLIAAVSFIIEIFCSAPHGKVNVIDSWWYNWNMKKRSWRIPQLCHFIHKKYGNVAELNLLGQRIVVVTNEPIANKLMTLHGHSLKQRFGSPIGLQHLNMHLNGLIWNNDIPLWKKNRAIFEFTLNRGGKRLDGFCRNYFSMLSQNIVLGEPISMLSMLRDFTITVTVTMEGLFGVQTNSAWRKRAIPIVGKYFQAWEFFLLTPDTFRFPEEEKGHRDSCHQMHCLSQEIYEMEKEPDGFIEAISRCNSSNGTLQCIAEMLLAGTDTSSLTMYYTLLFLADHPDLSRRISEMVNDPNCSKGECMREISHLYFESLRLIPVGPVIIRQAEVDIHYGSISLWKGDGIIFNVAGMNRSADYLDTEKFNPSRYQYDAMPLSFGTGKKSCVGRHFAEIEMKLFFAWFLRHYAVSGDIKLVAQLQTRWDVANTPETDIKLSIITWNH